MPRPIWRQLSKEGNPEGIYWQAELYREMGNTDYAITLYQSYLDGEEVTHQDAYERVAAYQLVIRVITTGALDNPGGGNFHGKRRMSAKTDGIGDHCL